LDDDGGHNNDEEKFVVEEVLEDVILVSFEFSCVDLIENLEQDENIEEDRIVLSCLVVPISDSN
jgi:hypothetical protein